MARFSFNVQFQTTNNYIHSKSPKTENITSDQKIQHVSRCNKKCSNLIFCNFLPIILMFCKEKRYILHHLTLYETYIPKCDINEVTLHYFMIFGQVTSFFSTFFEETSARTTQLLPTKKKNQNRLTCLSNGLFGSYYI